MQAHGSQEVPDRLGELTPVLYAIALENAGVGHGIILLARIRAFGFAFLPAGDGIALAANFTCLRVYSSYFSPIYTGLRPINCRTNSVLLIKLSTDSPKVKVR